MWCWPNCTSSSSSSLLSSPSLTSSSPSAALGFNNKPMNQPVILHQWSQKSAAGDWQGSFYGTWDLNSTSIIKPPPLPVIVPLRKYCDLSGTWLSQNGGAAVEIVVVQQSDGRFEATAKGQWTNVTGFVNATGEVTLDLAAHTDRGSIGNMAGSVCVVIDWSDGGNAGPYWCREPFCSTPYTPPQNPPSYFALEWFVRDGRRIFRNTLQTNANYRTFSVYCFFVFFEIFLLLL